MPTDPLDAILARHKNAPPLTDAALIHMNQHRGAAFSMDTRARQLAKDVDRLVAAVLTQRDEIEAYRSALGYSVSGDCTGRLSDGTTPVNGIAVAQQREIERLRIAHGEAMNVVETVETQLGRALRETARLHALIAEGHRHEWGPVGKRTAVCNWCPTHQTWPTPAPADEVTR